MSELAKELRLISHGDCEHRSDSVMTLIDKAADRIADLEAALRELLDAFNPEPRMDDIGLIWGRAAVALKGKA